MEQPLQPGTQAFRRFEIVLATGNAEREDPFPSRRGVILSTSLAKDSLWDGRQVEPPPLLDWISIAGEEISAAIRSGSQYAIGDTLTLGPGDSRWTRPILSRSALLPACPEMLAAGLHPFNHPDESGGNSKGAEWHDVRVDEFESGFYWLLPLSEREHAEASEKGIYGAHLPI